MNLTSQSRIDRLVRFVAYSMFQYYRELKGSIFMKRYTGRLSVLYAFIRSVAGDAGGPRAFNICGDDSVRLASMLNTADLSLEVALKLPQKF